MTQKALDGHQLSHQGLTEKFICDICGAEYMHKTSLTAHMKAKHPEVEVEQEQEEERGGCSGVGVRCLVKLQKKTVYIWLFLPGWVSGCWDACPSTWACILAKITICVWFSSAISNLLLLDVYLCPYCFSMIL